MKQLTTFGASGHALDDLQLFRDLGDDDAAAMLRDCAVVMLPAGEQLPDTALTCLHIVLRGALAVSLEAQAGAASDAAATRILPGECVGELAVLDNEASAARIVALADSELLAIDATTLWHLVDHCNGVARNLLRLMSFRVRAANAQLRRRQKVGEFYRQMSMVDGLTGLYNRAWLNDYLPGLVQQAHAEPAPLSLVMIDLDHFKRFNDTHGHLAGDDALKTAAKVLAQALRPTDFAVRYGGEELLVLLPDTPVHVAQKVAERLCDRIRHAVVFSDMRASLPHITASLGVACLAPGQDGHDLISAADTALYSAKHAGRDCVACQLTVA
ncbi:MAG TPA: GGDEF domain-containing protein [Burkholderiaceae bacterium]